MESDSVLFDAGIFIGALLLGDPRHAEARSLVEAARRGDTAACTTAGILSEVYAALTWLHAEPPHTPQEAADAVDSLIEPPSMIRVLETNQLVALHAMKLASAHQLRARRVHDARHAAAAIVAGISRVFTYDAEDWKVFDVDGLSIEGPASTLSRLA
jgi:predicted nucleic acid-binding protein